MENLYNYNYYHGEIQNNKHVDQILREYFPDPSYKGVFFDIGAFEPIKISNSYHFEKNNWDVYCFEANTEGIPLLKQYRKNVFNYAISNEDKDSVSFNIVTSNNWTAGFSAIEINEEYKQIFGWNPSSVIKITVPQKSLNTIIKEEIPQIKEIDIMSIDIEGGELNCLHGIDLIKYKPKVMVIENVTHSENIYNYLKKFGYVLDKVISYNEYYILK